jgi:dolichol-phosphate mannosyltransferase
MPEVTVCIPTYNEAENLPLMVEALLNLPVNNLRVLVIDDNSPDGTGAIANLLAAQHTGRMTVLHRREKAGFGSACIAGFKRAIAMNADYIIQMDADFSHQPEYIPQMVSAAKFNDLVVASRYIPKGSVDESWSVFRKFLSWFANSVYVKTILHIPVHDATSGFRLWRRQTLIGLDLDRTSSNGFVFQVETAYMACRLGYRIAEIPIHFPDRKRGISKMSPRIQAEAALRVWELRRHHHVLTPKMRRTQAYS